VIGDRQGSSFHGDREGVLFNGPGPPAGAEFDRDQAGIDGVANGPGKSYAGSDIAGAW